MVQAISLAILERALWVGLGYLSGWLMWRPGRGETPGTPGVQATGPVLMRRPVAKKKPKVMDDRAAWEREQEKL